MTDRTIESINGTFVKELLEGIRIEVEERKEDEECQNPKECAKNICNQVELVHGEERNEKDQEAEIEEESENNVHIS